MLATIIGHDFLWSVEQWLPFEEFWEVSFIDRYITHNSMVNLSLSQQMAILFQKCLMFTWRNYKFLDGLSSFIISYQSFQYLHMITTFHEKSPLFIYTEIMIMHSTMGWNFFQKEYWHFFTNWLIHKTCTKTSHTN